MGNGAWKGPRVVVRDGNRIRFTGPVNPFAHQVADGSGQNDDA